jgi:hypothetical protein
MTKTKKRAETAAIATVCTEANYMSLLLDPSQAVARMAAGFDNDSYSRNVPRKRMDDS